MTRRITGEQWAETNLIDRAAVLALIPEGAVLVTEETLAAQLYNSVMSETVSIYSRRDEFEAEAAAILARLRETQG
jgi:hypothetical protein